MNILKSSITAAAFLGLASLSPAQKTEVNSPTLNSVEQATEPDPPAVSYFPKDAVNAAFAKGSVLFDHSDKYMVHASRREQPGMAEIHTKDADIVYVLEGTATLVTGGTAANLKETAAGELRGERIDGGETRHLEKGDVIIVPAGVPHWFKKVSNPFLYYVVKAR